MPVVIFCGWHNTVTGDHAVAGVGCTWLVSWRGKRELSLLVLVLWPLSGGALFFGHSKQPSLLGTLAELRKATVSFIVSCLSVRPPVECLGSTGQILMKFDI